MDFVEFELDFVVLRSKFGSVETIEPFLRGFSVGDVDARGDCDVRREFLDLVFGEEEVGDCVRDEFLGGFFEGVALAEDEPEGERHCEDFLV